MMMMIQVRTSCGDTDTEINAMIINTSSISKAQDYISAQFSKLAKGL